jgi:hypothetical protein
MEFIKSEIKKYGLTVTCLGWLGLSAAALLINMTIIKGLQIFFSL